MFSKFKTDAEIIFLDPNVDIESKEAKTAVLLSPALYWVRSFELPLKSEKEAKKLLPSLFEEFLPEGEFSYFGYFDGERYIGFAYEEEKIRQLLLHKGVDLAQLEAFYFAQSELDEDMLPAQLGHEWMLASIDGIVVKLPFMKGTQSKALDLSSLALSSKSIKIERYAAPIERKTLYALCAIFLLFALLYGLEWWRVDQEVVRIQKRSDEIFARYSLLPTMTQNRSVLKKYEKIDTKQKKLRKMVAALLKASQATGGSLQSLRVEKESLHALFGNLADQRVLKKRLESLGGKITKLKSGAVAVEVRL